jgi:hypothetical protein
MNETETILFVGKIMLENNIITDFGFKILHNDFLADIAEPIEANELKKKTRVCVFMCVLFNMTLLYGGYCLENNISMEHHETLKPIAQHFEQVLPKMLQTLSNKYLEIFHGLKVNAFVHGHKFETYVPTHPEDQKVLDEIGYKEDDASPVVINV